MISKLPGIIEFTQEDLEANRRGVITDRQKRKVRQSFGWDVLKSIARTGLLPLIFLPLFMGLMLIPTFALLGTSNLNQWIPIGILVWGIVFIVGLVNSLYLSWNRVYTFRDLALNRLSFVSGRPYFSVKEDQVPPRPYIRFGPPRTVVIQNKLRLGGSVEFIVPEALEDMLDKRCYYRLYHLTRSRIILSIEEISET